MTKPGYVKNQALVDYLRAADHQLEQVVNLFGLDPTEAQQEVLDVIEEARGLLDAIGLPFSTLKPLPR